MANPGIYSDRLTWLQRSLTGSTSTGTTTEIFTDVGSLWCCLEEPRGSEKIYFGGLQAQVDYRCRVRGNPGVKSVDKFRDSEGAEYLIQGLCTTSTEQICSVVKIDN